MIDLQPASTRLSVVIPALPDDALSRPTPCSEYSISDLLDHIAGITVAFGGAAAKSRGVPADMLPQGPPRISIPIGDHRCPSA
jgi:hypothetical protein